MVWAGSPFAHRIEFNTGAPTGDISWRLLDGSGVELLAETVAPEAGAVSHLLVVEGSHNTCGNPLFESRTLIYSYITTDGLVSDRAIYRVEANLPFPVSPEGVRSKLGVEPHELRDEDIDLLTAHAELSSKLDMSAYETSGDYAALLCVHAIEATAGLMCLASLQLKVAQRENSGTNEYQRFASIDWGQIEASLGAHIERAKMAVDPDYDPTVGDSFFFGTTTRTDAITGA